MGIATGPVHAGFLGRKKVAYELYGDPRAEEEKWGGGSGDSGGGVPVLGNPSFFLVPSSVFYFCCFASSFRVFPLPFPSILPHIISIMNFICFP